MSFIIDTDMCSAYLKDDRRVFPRFMQYVGSTYMSAVTMMELQTWHSRSKTSPQRKLAIDDLFFLVPSIDINEAISRRCGEVRAQMLDNGVVVAVPDLLIAATALTFNFTLVTHNVRDFANVPGLRVQDWINP